MPVTSARLKRGSLAKEGPAGAYGKLFCDSVKGLALVSHARPEDSVGGFARDVHQIYKAETCTWQGDQQSCSRGNQS